MSALWITLAAWLALAAVPSIALGTLLALYDRHAERRQRDFYRRHWSA